MKVWLGCATEYYTSQPGNQNRPYGPMQIGDVILVYHFLPAETCAERTRLAWFPVEIGDHEDDVNAFVAAYPKPKNWNKLGSNERMKFYDNVRQIRESEIAEAWAIGEGVHPCEHGIGAPRVRLDIDALKAEAVSEAAKIDGCFDPSFMPQEKDLPLIDFATLKGCCQSVHAQYRADRILASSMIASNEKEALVMAVSVKAAEQDALYKERQVNG